MTVYFCKPERFTLLKIRFLPAWSVGQRQTQKSQRENTKPYFFCHELHEFSRMKCSCCIIRVHSCHSWPNICVHLCIRGKKSAAGGSYSCSFVAFVATTPLRSFAALREAYKKSPAKNCRTEFHCTETELFFCFRFLSSRSFSSYRSFFNCGRFGYRSFSNGCCRFYFLYHGYIAFILACFFISTLALCYV